MCDTAFTQRETRKNDTCITRKTVSREGHGSIGRFSGFPVKSRADLE